MDFDDPKFRAVFFDLHSGLPREGPGNRASTARALALAGAVPPKPNVLDIACGPGMQTMDLAELLPEATITALDLHEPFVAEANRRAAERGIGDRVTAQVGDMTALPFVSGQFDLIWCEGAAYMMGVDKALRAWRPLLRSGGKLALSEAVWLRSDPPERLRRCWGEAYPDMTDVPGCRDLVRNSGYDLLGDFVLPEEAWWDDYYTPKTERLRSLLPKYEGDPVAEAVFGQAEEEMADFKKNASYYGYVFLVMALPEGPN